jgi:Uncharacterized protein conserved in bacteria (DUF2334)
MISGRHNDSDMERTARLLLDAELREGVVGEGQALSSRPLRRAAHVPSVPPRPLRLVQQALYKLDRSGAQRRLGAPLLDARRALLGSSASAPPRFLVRVDEFPHYRAWDEPERFGTHAFERFHEIMAGAGVPYLLAVLPRVSRDPLSPADLGSRPLTEEELAMLARLREDRVAFALHGRTHRTRDASPRRHSELCGLSAADTQALLDDALGELAGHGIDPRVFVPPFNRFDAAQLPLLAGRFDVVCGGPESIGTLGLQRTPQWRGETVYLPSYAPFYGHADEVLGAAREAIEAQTGLWTPIVLHWGWEADDGFSHLERLAGEIAQYAADWTELLAAADRSRRSASTWAAQEAGEGRP